MAELVITPMEAVILGADQVEISGVLSRLYFGQIVGKLGATTSTHDPCEEKK